MRTVRDYLATLRRIPAPIILDMATREIDDTDACLVDWAVTLHELFLGERGPVLGKCPYRNPREAEQYFGGAYIEWSVLFDEIAQGETHALVEEAFARRVVECAGGRQ
jgi:hypothetical protein